MSALAAFLKPIVGPVVLFVGLLLARWGAIVVMRAMPQSRLKAALFDRGLLERKPAIVALVGLCVIAALLFWVWRFEGYI